MNLRLLVAAAPLAAIALFAAPAQAQLHDAPPTAAAPRPFDHFSALPTVHRGFWLDSRLGHHGRRHRGFPVVVGVPWGVSDGWALYNNRSWAPDSFNDWWHDRPDRAYPRWLQNNQNCDRMWWAGGAWRCSW